MPFAELVGLPQLDEAAGHVARYKVDLRRLGGEGGRDGRQEWLFVPELVPLGGQKTQPLAGAPVEAELMEVVDGAGKHMEHYTNIYRIEHLASEHPGVESVIRHPIGLKLTLWPCPLHGNQLSS